LTASGLIADSGRPQNSFKLVIPAKAGIQLLALPYEELDPAFAGMTDKSLTPAAKTDPA
jgi:hypothetical protein